MMFESTRDKDKENRDSRSTLDSSLGLTDAAEEPREEEQDSVVWDDKAAVVLSPVTTRATTLAAGESTSGPGGHRVVSVASMVRCLSGPGFPDRPVANTAESLARRATAESPVFLTFANESLPKPTRGPGESPLPKRKRRSASRGSFKHGATSPNSLDRLKEMLSFINSEGTTTSAENSRSSFASFDTHADDNDDDLDLPAEVLDFVARVETKVPAPRPLSMAGTKLTAAAAAAAPPLPPPPAPPPPPVALAGARSAPTAVVTPPVPSKFAMPPPAATTVGLTKLAATPSAAVSAAVPRGGSVSIVIDAAPVLDALDAVPVAAPPKMCSRAEIERKKALARKKLLQKQRERLSSQS